MAAPCKLVFDRSEEVAAYLERRLNTVLHAPYTTIGLEQAGRIVGGWLFNDYNGSNIEISAALDRPLTRGVIRAVAKYVFGQLRVRRVTARCRADNEKSAALIRRLGFAPVLYDPKYYPDGDALVFVLYRHQCRWINEISVSSSGS